MKRLLITVGAVILIMFSGGNGIAAPSAHRSTHKAIPSAARRITKSPAIPGSTYALVAWGELGMHCIDGKDYSVFSVLPPYNTIHAQLMKTAEPPTLITSGVTITYQATTDTTGSFNSSSAGKLISGATPPSCFSPIWPQRRGLSAIRRKARLPIP